MTGCELGRGREVVGRSVVPVAQYPESAIATTRTGRRAGREFGTAALERLGLGSEEPGIEPKGAGLAPNHGLVRDVMGIE
jgi:hypothetical protein